MLQKFYFIAAVAASLAFSGAALAEGIPSGGRVGTGAIGGAFTQSHVRKGSVSTRVSGVPGAPQIRPAAAPRKK